MLDLKPTECKQDYVKQNPQAYNHISGDTWLHG